MAHLFCELLYLYRAVGRNQGLSCTLPLTQVELAETLGLSSAHVNRTLQELRRQKLISLNGRTLTIQNLPALEELSFFNPDYLHLDYSGEKRATWSERAPAKLVAPAAASARAPRLSQGRAARGRHPRVHPARSPRVARHELVRPA